jgi:hypothetical protein
LIIKNLKELNEKATKQKGTPEASKEICNWKFFGSLRKHCWTSTR